MPFPGVDDQPSAFTGGGDQGTNRLKHRIVGRMIVPTLRIKELFDDIN
jgi:hypothetical protein